MWMNETENCLMKEKNIYETLKNTAGRFPQKCALIDPNGQVSFQELLRQTDRLAQSLALSCEVRQGDRIALLMTNSIHFCIAFYAVAKLGAIACPMSTKLQPAELSHMLCDTQAKLLFSDCMWQEKAKDATLNSCLQWTVWDRIPENTAENCRHMDWETLLERPLSRSLFIAAADPQLTVVIMYTSGTTGQPKGVTITHESILQNIYAYQEILRLDEREITLISVPVFHITGLSCVLALFVYIGGTSILTPFFHPAKALTWMERYHVTHYHAVPTIYRMLAETAGTKICLPALRTAVCGGGFIGQKDIEEFCRLAPNVSFHPAYGMTETAGAGVLFPKDCRRTEKQSCAGKIMPNTQIKVVDEQLHPVPIGSSGQICLRGGVVTKAYWNTAQSPNLQDGWLLTGDIGRVDKDGYVYILDRIKDMINRGGEKIYSLEVEDELRRCPGVKQAAVFALPDQVYGEIPAAAVVMEENAPQGEEEILAQLRTRLAKFKLPQHIVFYSELPCTPSGKVKKQMLRQMLKEKYCIHIQSNQPGEE